MISILKEKPKKRNSQLSEDIESQDTIAATNGAGIEKYNKTER